MHGECTDFNGLFIDKNSFTTVLNGHARKQNEILKPTIIEISSTHHFIAVFEWKHPSTVIQ